MKTAIVTGANGFVGSALVRELLHHDYTVLAADLAGHQENLPNDDRVSFVPLELAKIKELAHRVPEQRYDILFHLAWAGSAGPARADTALQLQNAQWTVDVLRTAKELGCKRVLCAGSIMEHETMAAAYTQGNRPGPGYIYGGGKLIAHVMCMSVALESAARGWLILRSRSACVAKRLSLPPGPRIMILCTLMMSPGLSV